MGSIIALAALGGVAAAMAASGPQAPLAATATVLTHQAPSTVRAASPAEVAGLRALYTQLPSATPGVDPAAEEAPPASVTMPDHSNDIAASSTIIATAPLAGVSMFYPVNAPVTSDFGLRLHPIFGDWRLHTGTDFGAPCGTPTVAVRAGTVTFAGVVSGYGNRIVVDHGSVAGKKLESTYNHLSLIAVTTGQTLQAGEPLGRVGTTGNSTGCHLHFEVMISGTYTDPMPYLNGRPSTAVVTVPTPTATPTPTPTAPAATEPAQPQPTTPTPTETPTTPAAEETPTPTPATPTPATTETPAGTSSTGDPTTGAGQSSTTGSSITEQSTHVDG